MHVEIKLETTTINCINLYGPTGENAKARKKLFFGSLRNKFNNLSNLVVMGDWNHIEDNTRDKVYLDQRNNLPSIDDVPEYTQFINNNTLIDTYLQEYLDEDNDQH